jgi:aryl-alcohol dehydrogenase-like predicted oxidoreductase
MSTRLSWSRFRKVVEQRRLSGESWRRSVRDDGYTNGAGVRILGEFVASDRRRFVVATKYSFNQRRGDPNASGNHRKNLVLAGEGSLKRLRLDCVDLYCARA